MEAESITPNLEAWKAFITDGTVLEDKVRPVVVRSWQRCRTAGLDPWMDALKPDFSLLKMKKSENRVLLSVADPAMQVALTLLNANISLSDNSGYVFELISPLKYYPRSLAVHYSEAIGGTSCITVSLVEDIPVRIDTYEHYAIGGHTYSGATCPVRSGDRRLGYLHAVNPFELLAPRALPLITAGAELMEHQLARGGCSLQDEKVRQLLQTMLDACPRSAVLLDTEGVIQASNSIFNRAVGLPEDSIVVGAGFGDLLADPRDLSVFTHSNFLHGQGRHFRFKSGPAAEDNSLCEYQLNRKSYIGFSDDRNRILLVFGQPDTASEGRRSFSVSAPAEREHHSVFDVWNCIGESPAWEEVKNSAIKIAPFPTAILLQGESGTGKEVVARVVHVLSKRKGRYVGINCGAIPTDLLYSELFGYEEGAFTGARKGGAIGKFEYADGGTLFLDEIGEMSHEMQISLLRAIQEKSITRFGSNEPRPVDVRIIAATNKDLRDLIRNGLFREDLYYRLSVVEMTLPALRDRPGDIDLLAGYYIEELARQYNIKSMMISDEALEILNRFNWPGNVRELRNVIEKAMIMATGDVITPEMLPPHLLLVEDDRFDGRGVSPDDLNSNERKLIIEVIARCNGNIARSARALNISRGALYRKLEKYRIQIDTKAE